MQNCPYWKNGKCLPPGSDGRYDCAWNETDYSQCAVYVAFATRGDLGDRMRALGEWAEAHPPGVNISKTYGKKLFRDQCHGVSPSSNQPFNKAATHAESPTWKLTRLQSVVSWIGAFGVLMLLGALGSTIFVALHAPGIFRFFLVTGIGSFALIFILVYQERHTLKRCNPGNQALSGAKEEPALTHWAIRSGNLCAMEADKQGLVRYGTGGVGILAWCSSQVKAPASVSLSGSVTCPGCGVPARFKIDCSTDYDLLSGPKITCGQCQSRVDFTVWVKKSESAPRLFVTAMIFSHDAGRAPTLPVVKIDSIKELAA